MHDHSAHVLDPSRGSERVERALWVALLLNLGFLLVEVGVGIWADSLALLSDAGHMVADVAALAFALVAQRLSRREANGAYTFGLRRMPVLGAFGNALTLLFIAGMILWEAWQRLRNPPAVAAWPVLIAGVTGLLVNLISAWWLHRSTSENLNVRGAVLHLLADALGSVGAIAVAIVLMTTGWRPVDAVVSAFIAALILIATWPLLRDSARVLLQRAPDRIPVERLRAIIQECPQVRRILDLHVWEIDAGLSVLTATVMAEACTLRDTDRATDGLRRRLAEELGIKHATFEWRSLEGSTEGCERCEDADRR
jgi:cobalt-zinc-cadmium efflux system protein